MLGILLILIFIRPFISSLASFCENSIYTVLLLSFLAVWIIIRGIHLHKVKPIIFPLVLFIVALVISLIFSRNRAISIEELYKYASGILLLYIGISLSEKEKNSVIVCIVLAGFVISLTAIYQYFFGFQNLLIYAAKKGVSDPFVLDYIGRRRPFYPFVTPNILAGYLGMIIPLIFTQKHKPWLIIPLSFALLLTKSMGALLSLFLGLIIYLYLKGNLKKKGILFLVVLLIIITGVLISRYVAQKSHTLPMFSVIMRLNYWEETLRIIKIHPWLGTGLGNFNLIQSRYAHNSYLQVWAEAGILGIVSFLWLMIAVFKKGFRNLSLTTASAVFLMHNFVDFTFFLPEVSLIWWILLGLTLIPPKIISK